MNVFLGVMLILMFSNFCVANNSHPASEFWIEVDELELNLQDAFDGGLLIGSRAYVASSFAINLGHSVEDIWISTGSGEMTLLYALVNEISIIGSSLTYSEVTPIGGHLATDVIFSSGENLQEIINSGSISGVFCYPHDYFLCYDNDEYWYNSCEEREEIKKDCYIPCTAWSGYYEYKDCWFRRYRICYTTGCSEDSCYSTSYYQYTAGEVCVNGGICVGGYCASTGCVFDFECDDGYCVGFECQSDDDTVVCTELHNTGFMSDEIYARDVEYSREYFSQEALEGYRSWGIPVVRLMRKNTYLKDITVLIVDSFLEESSYRFGESEVGNEMGKYYLDNAVPLFERIGVLIDDPDWESLFIEDSWINSIIGFFDKKNPNDEIVENYFTEEKVAEMFYNALGDKAELNMEFTIAFVKELEKAVEDIERLVKESEE